MPKLTITMNEKVREKLENEAKRLGLSMSAYISILVMNREIEYQTTRMLMSLIPDQIKKHR